MAFAGADLSDTRICGCEGVDHHYRLDDDLARTQQIADLFIFLSYFSIPLELLYFLACSKLVFPFKWIIVQFGAFIVLCGLTHLIAMWTYHEHTYGIALTQTVMKVLTAVVSCATALTLVYIIPELLSLKVREVYLRSKAEQLDREIGVVRRAEETGRNVRMLTSEIRSTLDRHTILKTTLVELGKTLQLWNCMLWMAQPGSQSSNLTLMYQLREDRSSRRPAVSVHDPVVQSIFGVNTALLISTTSGLALGDESRFPDDGAVVAIRVPILHTSPTKRVGSLDSLVEAAIGAGGGIERSGEDIARLGGGQVGRAGGDGTGWLGEANGRSDGENGRLKGRSLGAGPAELESGGSARRNSRAAGEFAVLVLVLPGASARRWRAHELEMVESVADQVAVALSHAAVLEESQRVQERLIQQNEALVIARQEAETAIKARNDFLAVMNHEMRTPMHAIIALTSLLQEDDSLTKDQRMMVETIVKSSALLSTLINDILDFSRLEDGRLGLDPTHFQLPALLKEAENLARPMAVAKNLELKLTVDPDVPVNVIGDEKRLFQVTLNILGNAVKFTKEGSVTLHVSPEDFTRPTDPRRPPFRPPPEPGYSYIRVECTDTGLGINPGDIGKLFNKFVQADSTTTRKYGGTGLGLAICKKFVELMDGVIWIESGGLGTGSRVSYIVKLGVVAPRKMRPVESPRQVAQAAAKSEEDLKGLRVLVTDDNGVNRLVTRRLLDRLGCDTTVVDSGARCLATLESGQQFAVLLLDLAMPQMDGYEVCTRIHQRFPPGERPLVVALTANTDQETRLRCMKLDMDGIILKPVALDEMRSVLCELLWRQDGSSPLMSPHRPPSVAYAFGLDGTQTPNGAQTPARRSSETRTTNMGSAVLPPSRLSG